MSSGPKYRESGGGAATGLADDFIKFLQGGLQTGSFGGVTAGQRFNGADPVGATGGISGILNDLLSGGAGQLGGSLQQLISKDTNRQADALRARFGASGGTAFGTPAAYAEGVLRSEQGPKLATAIGGMQQGAIQQLLQLMGGLSQKGIAQREGYLQQPAWVQTIGALAPLIKTGLGAATGNPLAALMGGGGGGGGFSVGGIPNINTPQIGQGMQFGVGGTPNFSMGNLFGVGR